MQPFGNSKNTESLPIVSYRHKLVQSHIAQTVQQSYQSPLSDDQTEMDGCILAQVSVTAEVHACSHTTGTDTHMRTQTR